MRTQAEDTIWDLSYYTEYLCLKKSERENFWGSHYLRGTDSDAGYGAYNFYSLRSELENSWGWGYQCLTYAHWDLRHHSTYVQVE